MLASKYELDTTTQYWVITIFKIPADFPTQCSDACLALHYEKTSRTSTARFRTMMHQRQWSCHWEATLAGSYNFPPELPDTQATAVSHKVSVAGHDTC